MARLDTTPRPWTFRDPKTNEERTYEQRELTIDGEIQMFSLLSRSLGRLREVGFPFEDLAKVIPTDASDMEHYDWKAAGDMAAMAALAVPSLASEAMAIMLGMFPVDENGKRDATWNEDVAFIRRSIHVADVVEAIQTFVAQNDVERLQAPFVSLIRSVMIRGQQPSPPIDVAMRAPSTSSSAAATDRPARSDGTSVGPTSPVPSTP